MPQPASEFACQLRYAAQDPNAAIIANEIIDPITLHAVHFVAVGVAGAGAVAGVAGAVAGVAGAVAVGGVVVVGGVASVNFSYTSLPRYRSILYTNKAFKTLTSTCL